MQEAPWYAAGIVATPVKLNDDVIVGTFDGNETAVNRVSNQIHWIFRAKGPIASSATTFGRTVIFGSGFVESQKANQPLKGMLYAIDGGTGKVLWSFVTGGDIFSTPVVYPDGQVCFGSRDHKMYSIDAKTAQLKWTFATKGEVNSSPAIGQDGTLYFGSDDSYIYALDRLGKLRWSFKTSGKVDSSPRISANNILYIGSDDGKLYAMDGKTGRLIWSFQTDGPISSSPAIASSGTIYVGSEDGHIYGLIDRSHSMNRSQKR